VPASLIFDRVLTRWQSGPALDISIVWRIEAWSLEVGLIINAQYPIMLCDIAATGVFISFGLKVGINIDYSTPSIINRVYEILPLNCVNGVMTSESPLRRLTQSANCLKITSTVKSPCGRNMTVSAIQASHKSRAGECLPDPGL